MANEAFQVADFPLVNGTGGQRCRDNGSTLEHETEAVHAELVATAVAAEASYVVGFLLDERHGGQHVRGHSGTFEHRSEISRFAWRGVGIVLCLAASSWRHPACIRRIDRLYRHALTLSILRRNNQRRLIR